MLLMQPNNENKCLHEIFMNWHNIKLIVCLPLILFFHIAEYFEIFIAFPIVPFTNIPLLFSFAT